MSENLWKYHCLRRLPQDDSKACKRNLARDEGNLLLYDSYFAILVSLARSLHVHKHRLHDARVDELWSEFPLGEPTDELKEESLGERKAKNYIHKQL